MSVHITSNSQLWGCLNPPWLVLFSVVDVVSKYSSVNKTTVNAGSWFPKAFVSSAWILNLPITPLPVDNFNDRALWCKPTGINYNMHDWILCVYCPIGWFRWIRGLRAVTMWSSSSFTKTMIYVILLTNRMKGNPTNEKGMLKHISYHTWVWNCGICRRVIVCPRSHMWIARKKCQIKQ